jgi:succinate dehydrogenase/fumarate reductase cytochrome b subunit
MMRLDRAGRGSGPRRMWRWLDPRGRHLGTWAFVANRLTGLGLVAYLYLHLAILSTLLRGSRRGMGW